MMKNFYKNSKDVYRDGIKAQNKVKAACHIQENMDKAL